MIGILCTKMTADQTADRRTMKGRFSPWRTIQGIGLKAYGMELHLQPQCDLSQSDADHYIACD